MLIKLGHRDSQGLAGVGRREVKRDALDCSLGLHGAQGLFHVTWKEVWWHSHRVYTYVYVFDFEFNVYKPSMSGLDPIPEENLAWDYYYRLYYDDDEDEFVPPENQNYIYTTPMAEGGCDHMDLTTEKDPLIPGTGDDDTDWDNTDLNQPPDDTDSTHNPFEPDAASTPADEQIQMTTRTKLPQESGPRTAETSFIEGDRRQNLRNAMEEDAWQDVKDEFEQVDKTKIDVRYKAPPISGKDSGGIVVEVKLKNGKRWYTLYTKSKGDTKPTFNQSLTPGIKTALGPSLTEILSDTNAAVAENQQRLIAKQKELEQAEQRAAEAQKFRRDMDAMRSRIKDVDDQIRELEDAHGPLDTEGIQRLKDEKRALESDHQSKRQQLSQLQKNAKQADKIRQNTKRTHA